MVDQSTQLGYVSRSQIAPARKGNTAKSTRSEITATPRPALTISVDAMLQGAAAMALGGVDTGRQ